MAVVHVRMETSKMLKQEYVDRNNASTRRELSIPITINSFFDLQTAVEEPAAANDDSYRFAIVEKDR